jgi:hypothetical protein
VAIAGGDIIGFAVEVGILGCNIGEAVVFHFKN